MGKHEGFRRVRKIAKNDYHLFHVCFSVCPSNSPSVCMEHCMATTGRIFMRFYI